MKASICVLAAALLAASAGQALSAPAKTPAKTAAKAPPAKAAVKVVVKAPVKAPAHRKSHRAVKPALQTWTSGHCRLTIPAGWSDWHGGKADAKDRGFNVTLARAGDPKSMTATLKAMRGRVVSDKADMVLVQVALRGRDARQYWAVTRPGPGCRATVTFADSTQEIAARKIAESLRKER